MRRRMLLTATAAARPTALLLGGVDLALAVMPLTIRRRRTGRPSDGCPAPCTTPVRTGGCFKRCLSLRGRARRRYDAPRC